MKQLLLLTTKKQQVLSAEKLYRNPKQHMLKINPEIVSVHNDY